MGICESIREEVAGLVIHGGGGLGWNDVWNMSWRERRVYADVLRRDAEARAEALRKRTAGSG